MRRRLDPGAGDAYARLVELLGAHPELRTRVVVFNNTLPDALLAALEACAEPWAADPATLHNIHYEPAYLARDILAVLDAQGPFSLVVVERLDRIMQEPGPAYAEQNRSLVALMLRPENAVYIDAWPWMERFWTWDCHPA